MSTISASTTSTTAYKVTADTTGTLVLQTGSTPTTAVTIDSSQNVGIGTTSPATILNASRDSGLSTGTGTTIALRLSDTGQDGGAGTWNTTQQFTAVQFYSADASGAGAAVRASVGATMESGNGATSALTFFTNASGTNTERARIDSSGNFLVGTTATLGAKFALYGTGGGTNSNIQITNPGYGTGCIGVQGTSSNFKLYNCYSSGTLGTGAGIDIDTSGNLLVGTTSITAYGKVSVAFNGAAYNGATYNDTNNTTGAGFIYFLVGGTSIGSITRVGSGSTINYATSSDYRLKENIAPMTGALDIVQRLKPVTYTWKADGANGQGFIAHELAEVCPDAVVGEKDAVNEDGSIKSQGIDTSFLVATLTAAIQELKAELDAAKADIATLKGAA